LGTSEPLTIPETDSGATDHTAGGRALGLAVVWCSFDPSKVGAWLRARENREIFGRGPAQASDRYPRAVATFQRPGENMPAGTFDSPSLSRVQLELHTDASRLAVVNVGQCRVSLNGIPVDAARLAPGDLLEVGNQVAFICVERPLRLNAAAERANAFGKADEHGLVGETPRIWRLRQELAFAATRSGHVLIQGPSGTGKELAATAIHAQSGRFGPLVSRNAATFPESLIDAELFGNAKGYPNIGTPERKGLIGAADGGSLFLDEFGELPPPQQARLLRVLDAGEYQRLGESIVRRATFRMIAATNRGDEALREDVLARFAFRIHMPQLAERLEDIPLLVRHLLDGMTAGDAELRARYWDAKGNPRIGLSLIRGILRSPPQANVRELRNVLWKALRQNTGDTLECGERNEANAQSHDAQSQTPRQKLVDALEAHGGSLEKTWRALGLTNRFVLMRLLKKHNIQVRMRAAKD
jgi:DNA-binding NtrC family response regulator